MVERRARGASGRRASQGGPELFWRACPQAGAVLAGAARWERLLATLGL